MIQNHWIVGMEMFDVQHMYIDSYGVDSLLPCSIPISPTEMVMISLWCTISLPI